MGEANVDGIQGPGEPEEPYPNKRDSPLYLHQNLKKMLDEYRKMDVVGDAQKKTTM